MVSISLDPTTEEWQKDAALLKRVEGRKSVTAANGANHNVDPGEGTFIDISGPTAVFNITGFSGGKEGRFLIIFNRSGFALTLTNESASSTAANRFTLGSDSVVPTKSGIILTYSGQDSRWIFVSRSGEVGVWTEAAGKVTLGTPGNEVGINEVAPTAKLEVKSDDANQKILIVKTGGTGSAGLDPGGLAGCTLVYDANVGIYEDAAKADPCEADDPVYTWDDAKDNVDAQQASVTLRPIWRVSHHAGEDGVDFDGSNDLLALGTTFNLLLSTTAYTIIAVVKPDTFSNEASFPNNDAIYGSRQGGTASNIGMMLKTPDICGVYSTSGGTVWTTTKTGVVVSGWNILIHRWGSNLLECGVNDPTDLGSQATTGTVNPNDGNVQLGRYAGVGQYLDGAIGYLATFNVAKSNADLLDMVYFLAARFGITLPFNTGQAVNFFEILDLNGASLLRMDSTGRVIIGVVGSPSYDLELANDSAGKPGTSTWAVVSDERLKREVADFNVGKNVLRALQPIQFKYKHGVGLPSEQIFHGLSAQKVQKHFPQMVQIDRNGNLTLNYHAIFLMLINTIKELYERTDLLEARQSNMISSIQDLQSRLNALENP